MNPSEEALQTTPQNPYIIPPGLNYLHYFSSSNNYDDHQKSSTPEQAEDPRCVSTINEEKRQRRILSNRESARRSRMRKQRRIMDLWSQVLLLRTENGNLIDRLNSVSESHEKVLQENSLLKKEASDLSKLVTDLHCKEKESSAGIGGSACNSFERCWAEFEK